MPELPEVEICRRKLARWATAKRLAEIQVLDAAVVRSKLSSRPSDALEGGGTRLETLVGGIAKEPIRKGKRLGWVLGDEALLIHLGMTGQWVQRSDPAPPRHARLGFKWGNSWVWFVDSRRFGCVVPIELSGLEKSLGAGLGPDGLNSPPNAAELALRLKGRRPVKAALMDQQVLAGVGNIHAVEALWRARIHPATPCNRLTTVQFEAISAAIPAQFEEAIRVQDNTEFAYISDGGPNPFVVYDHKGSPCPRCSSEIVMEKMGGRATYYCPGCQA